MTNLEKDTYTLINQILETDLVKRYLKAKELYYNDSNLNKLREEIKIRKKKLPSFTNKKLTLQIHQIKELENQLDNNPICITYFNLKNEVENLIQPLKDLFR